MPTSGRASREGCALCQGIIFCGSCGKPMRTSYHTDQRPYRAANWTHGKIPVIPVVVGLAAFFAVILPFNSVYRAEVRTGATRVTPYEAITESPAIAARVLDGLFSPQVMAQSADTLAARIQEINAPAIVTPTDFYSSAAITPWADLYSHGGWAVVLVGMFLLGCLVRVLYDVLDVRTDPSAVFLVLLVFPSLVKAENDWVSTVAGVPTAIIIWLVLRAVTYYREPSLSAPQTSGSG
jgi:hypothetical protein